MQADILRMLSLIKQNGSLKYHFAWIIMLEIYQA